MANSINKMCLSHWQYYTTMNMKDYHINNKDLLFQYKTHRCKFTRGIYKVNARVHKFFKVFS